MKVIIGVDPHKATHTAVALDGNEVELGRLQVRANASQTKRLLRWAGGFDERTWAVEGAGGWGYLLSQQLLAAGETVLDVPATLAARVRVLGSGKSNKNDPNDARSVAIAALRAPGLAAVRSADHATVLRLLAKRNHQLNSHRTRTVSRLHSLLAELLEGGLPNKLKAKTAEAALAKFRPATPAQAARQALALDHLEDLRRVEAQIAVNKGRIVDAVEASGTTVTDIHGAGPIVAAMAVGYSGDVRRFASRDHYASYTGTAAIELSTGGRTVHRLSRRGTASSTTPSTSSPTPRSPTPLTAAPTTSARSPRARPTRRPSALSSGASATRCTDSYSSTPTDRAGSGGHPGATLASSATGLPP